MLLSRPTLTLTLVSLLALGGCDDSPDPDAGGGGGTDAGMSGSDAGVDGATPGTDAGPGMDAAMPDAGTDAGTDAGLDGGPPEWRTREGVDMGSTTIRSETAGIVMNAEDDALVFFHDAEDTTFSMNSRWFRTAGGAERFDRHHLGGNFLPGGSDLNRDSGRAALAYTVRPAGSDNMVFVRRYDPAMGWLAAEMITSGPGRTAHDLAMDAADNIYVVVSHGTSMAAHVRDSTGWTMHEFREGPVRSARVAAGAAGDAFAMLVGDGGFVFASRYVAGAWTREPQILGLDSAPTRFASCVALDRLGNGYAVITESATSRTPNVVAARLDPVAGWQTQESLESIDEDMAFCSISVNDAGVGMVSFHIHFADGRRRGMGRRIAAGAFGETVTLTPAEHAAHRSVIAVDDRGLATVAYTVVGTPDDEIFARRELPDGTFSDPVSIDTATLTIGGFFLATGTEGRAALAYWTWDRGTEIEAWMVRFE